MRECYNSHYLAFCSTQAEFSHVSVHFDVSHSVVCDGICRLIVSHSAVCNVICRFLLIPCCAPLAAARGHHSQRGGPPPNPP